MRGRAIGMLGLGAIAVALTACTPPGLGEPEPTDDRTAIAEAGEIGVLADMTGTECAVAGAPWYLDDHQFDRDYSLAMMALDPEVASSGIGGNYALDLWADGRIRIATVGYTVSTTSKAVDETGAFDHIRLRGSEGSATAEWAEASDDGATVVFIDWSSDIVDSAPVWDDGTPYPGTLPAWQLPGQTGAVFECTEDGTGLWVRPTTPGYLDLYFVR